MADRCPDWYRLQLRDPRGVYVQNPGLEKDVLTLATNGLGGYVAKPAACKFRNGNLDQHWTEIRVSSAGW